jgi:hypothetical protein
MFRLKKIFQLKSEKYILISGFNNLKVGVTNQDLTMFLKTGYRDEEINVCYGNIYHMFSMDMVNKYIPWNGK